MSEIGNEDDGEFEPFAPVHRHHGNRVFILDLSAARFALDLIVIGEEIGDTCGFLFPLDRTGER